MEVMHEICAGLDVHKDTVVACVRKIRGREISRETRTFRTDTKSLIELFDWLAAEQVTHAVMESTGVYWKPVWRVLEGGFELVLANAAAVKNVPGRKSDVNDAQWLADLMAHGLVRGSLVPDEKGQDLRDLTRTRKQLGREQVQHRQRIQKVLGRCNIKLASVVSDIIPTSAVHITRWTRAQPPRLSAAVCTGTGSIALADTTPRILRRNAFAGCASGRRSERFLAREHRRELEVLVERGLREPLLRQRLHRHVDAPEDREAAVASDAVVADEIAEDAPVVFARERLPVDDAARLELFRPERRDAVHARAVRAQDPVEGRDDHDLLLRRLVAHVDRNRPRELRLPGDRAVFPLLLEAHPERRDGGAGLGVPVAESNEGARVLSVADPEDEGQRHERRFVGLAVITEDRDQRDRTAVPDLHVDERPVDGDVILAAALVVGEAQLRARAWLRACSSCQ